MASTFWRGIAVAAAVMLLGGCAGAPHTSYERVQLHKGESMQCFRLLEVQADGQARFRNWDAGDTDHFAPFLVKPGQSLGLERETGAPFPRRRSHTLWDFTVEKTDPQKQEATVLIARTDD